MQKIISVVCAIIEEGDHVLCAQRSQQMALPLKWEFPGGKIELGEKEEEALIREIKEELNLDIEVIKRMPVNYHAYVPKKVIELRPFLCAIKGDFAPKLAEHSQLDWVSKENLLSLDWAEADIPVVLNYLKQ